jgi:hypothetical protein
LRGKRGRNRQRENEGRERKGRRMREEGGRLKGINRTSTASVECRLGDRYARLQRDVKSDEDCCDCATRSPCRCGVREEREKMPRKRDGGGE